jgi:tetratricopeptide (TPR) repeat protein
MKSQDPLVLVDALSASDDALFDAQPDEATYQLAVAFVREPELVRACLPDGDTTDGGWGRRVLAAAKLALMQAPHYADLLYNVAYAAEQLDAHATALQLLERALAINPTYKDALILAGRVALRRQESTKARTLLQRAVAAGADYPDVHLLLADAHGAEGNWEEARAACQRALKRNPQLAAAHAVLASIADRQANGAPHELPA